MRSSPLPPSNRRRSGFKTFLILLVFSAIPLYGLLLVVSHCAFVNDSSSYQGSSVLVDVAGASTSLPRTDRLGVRLSSQDDSGIEKLRKDPTRTIPPQQNVYVCPPDQDSEQQGELNHFIYDGVSRSARLRRTKDPDDASAVWLVDIKRCNCQEVLIPAVRDVSERRRAALMEGTGVKRRLDTAGRKSSAHRVTNQPKGAAALGWNLYMLDYSDTGFGITQKSCPEQLLQLFNGNRKYLHLATRHHTKGRAISHAGRKETEPFTNIGTPKSPDDFPWSPYIHGQVRVLRYGVRSDQIDYYERKLNGIFNFDHGARESDAVPGVNEENVLDLITLPRPKDVAHFWDAGTDRKKGAHRGEVSRAIQSLGHEHNNLAICAETLGERAKVGRNSVQNLYANALLEYKIVVVCQRDQFEGHYRLMEALAGGAMVMTDPMQPLPVYLEDGVSVVVYRSLAELKQKILYYLENKKERLDVARRGHAIAMTHHRSWHGIERIIFGNWSLPQGVR